MTLPGRRSSGRRFNTGDDAMANVDYTPDLSGLEQDYQILTELHRSGDSRTYLARHLGLNRDVTITVVHATDAAEYQSLTQFAADTRILAKARHPNIIPIIEGRQLANDTFAVVRARVRGSTLHQMVAAIGAVPLPRAALQDIFSALEWARKGGIFHRHVSPDDLIFQQGSGRVLLAFDPVISVGDASWDRCADARTIGRLAWEMLAGQPSDNPDAKTLAELRPDLSKRIIDETIAMMNCQREGPPPNIPAYLMMLGSPPSVLSATMTATRAPVPQSPPTPAEAPKRVADDAVIVVKRGLGFNARVAVAAAVLAVVVLVVLFLVRRTSADDSLSASRTQRSDTISQAAGDVAGRSRAETSAFVARPRQAARVAPQPTVIVPPTDTTSATARVSRGDSMLAAPDQRRHEPGRPTTPAVTMPNARASTDSASGDACASSAPADQRSCLKSAIQRGDASVNRVYRQLIAALRAQAGAEEGDPDPSSVTEVRESQTKWLDDRDTACAQVGAGPMYAKARAQCYADAAGKRLKELQELMDEIPKL